MELEDAKAGKLGRILKCSSLWWIQFIAFLLLSLQTALANNPPRFLLTESEILLQLKEGPETPVGSQIYTLKGEDPEGDPLTFGVRGQIGNDLIDIVTVDLTTADVYLKRELDRETQDDYQLILTLSDGQRGNVIEQSMRILVQDINDNEPIFKPYNATIHIKEGWPPGIIGTLEATDLDEGSYGQVVYRLQETDDSTGNFKIETVNGKGVLSFIHELDYEEKYLYQLQVLAVDRPSTGRRNTGTAAIIIKVEDIEDQPPEFLKLPSITKVPEDLPVNSRILEAWAIDGDRGINNIIHYSIVGGHNDMFGIEQDTGWVYVQKPLDRENKERNVGYIIKIRASEVGSNTIPAPSTDAEATILLSDINDETPRFKSEQYMGEINENAQLNVPITFLGSNTPDVYDYDQGRNGTFTLSLEGDNGIFEITPQEVINEATFLIRVKNQSSLDYEKQKTLHFKIIAKEVSVNPKSSTADITVHIRDANDNIPEFETSEYVAYIREDVRAETSVTKIVARDRDSGDFGTAGIRYVEIRGQIAKKLSLDPITGVVTVKSGGEEFDREQVSTYFLTVVARDNLGLGNRNTVQLQLIIDDVNDNSPQFMQNIYEARVSENESEFPHPFIIEAFDRDLEGTVNNEIRYKIIGGDPKNNFSINNVSGEITLKSPLDFEVMNGTEEHRFFNLTVEAQDLGKPPLSSRVNVIIYVQDKNDHSPVFSEPFYNASVREDIRPGDPIIQLHAYDHDGSPTNNRIVYRIISGAQDKFVIHATKGVISVAHGASLDPDKTEPKTLFHVLNVAAIDGGIGKEQKQTTVLVNISVLDVNNKAPEFQEPGTVVVKENLPVGTQVAVLKAIDRDNNPDLKFALDSTKCEARNEDGALVRLMPKDYHGLFEITPEGLVLVKGSLDRELVETIKLRVTVEDRNAVGFRQTAIGSLTIKIEDINDNNPAFQKPIYRRAVPENFKPGTIILHIAAEDKDVNRTLLYQLQGPEFIFRLVSLQPQTGELLVQNKVDREQFPWLNFTVKATDNGIPPRSGYANVSIQILDENDNNPVFIHDSYVFDIPEDTPVGFQVGIIQARDADAGEYGRVTYLLDKKTAHGKFNINPNTGALTVTDELDRETRDKYILVVEAWDNYETGFSTGESRNAFKQVVINVTDKNDMVPEIVKHEQCIAVTEYHGVGEVVSVIKAKDGDDPMTPNSQVDFKIEKGNEKGLFSIEPSGDYTTARLKAVKPLKQQIGNHTLTIVATDRGSPPLQSSQDLNVCVTDFNDHAPSFIKPSQNHTIRISEDLPIGTPLVTVEAIDDDVGPNGEVRFNILNDPRGDWQAFAIHEVTGVITLKRALDRERQKKYEIRVEAHDLGVPTPLASDMDVHFYVKNVVDVEPRFSNSETVITFMENVKPGSEIHPLPETIDTEEYDTDDDKSLVCYFIVGGNEDDMFHVDPIRHEVSLTAVLDREARDSYEFLVKARKDCENPLPPTEHHDLAKDGTLLKVIVEVQDDNDNEPHFVKEIFTGGMTTDSAFGNSILRVQAIDKDIGINGRLSYYIIGNIQSTLSDGLQNLGAMPFIMNHTTGNILLNFYPQKTMKGYFQFKVLVNDTDGLEDIAQVKIYLVREDQKLLFTLRITPDELRPRIDRFQTILSNLTGTIVNIDAYKFHDNKDGSVDRTKSDVYAHFVEKGDNSIMNVKGVTKLLDEKIEDLNSLFQEFNVLEGKAAVSNDDVSGPEEILIAWLIGSTACLGILLILALGICLAQRNRYERQLKAATVIAFGSQESNLNRANVPNTNQHSIEGSNPIWMHSYENEWYKEDDSVSSGSPGSDSNNSLDENVINDTDENSRSSTTPPQDYPSSYSNQGTPPKRNNCGTSSCSTTASRKPRREELSKAANCIKEQNDLNKLGINRHNLYDSLGINSNTLLSHIETTEL